MSKTNMVVITRTKGDTDGVLILDIFLQNNEKIPCKVGSVRQWKEESIR